MTIQFDRINSEPADFLEKCANIALYSYRTVFGERVEIKNSTEYSLQQNVEMPVWARVSIAALTIIFCVIPIIGYVCTRFSATYHNACVAKETVETNIKFEAFLSKRIPAVFTEFTEVKKELSILESVNLTSEITTSFFEVITSTMLPSEFDSICAQEPKYKLWENEICGWTLGAAVFKGNVTLVRHILMKAPDEFFIQYDNSLFLKAIHAPLAVRFTLFKDLINAGIPVNLNNIKSKYDEINILDEALEYGEENLKLISYLLSMGAERSPVSERIEKRESPYEKLVALVTRKKGDEVLEESAEKMELESDRQLRPLLRKAALPMRQQMGAVLLSNSLRPEGSKLPDDILQIILAHLSRGLPIAKPFTKGEALFALREKQ